MRSDPIASRRATYWTARATEVARPRAPGSAVAATRLAPADTTLNWKLPSVVCPSSRLTASHFTRYVPGAFVESTTAIRTPDAVPGNTRPVGSSTTTWDRRGFTASEKLRVTMPGAVPSRAPAAGEVDMSSACASTPLARIATNRAQRAKTIDIRTTERSRINARLR